MDCWLARDGFGMLQLHHSKPFWDDKKEDWISGLKIGILSSLDFEFKDVTFENSPVKVEINFKNSKNMEKKINIAELLKDCPKGMELDCVMYDNVEFDGLDNVDNESEYTPLILCKVKTSNGYISHTFTKYGCYTSHEGSKCVIFPKGKTTWEGFVPPVTVEFKDGDIVCTTLGNIVIIKNISGEHYSSYCGVFGNDDFAIDTIVSPMRLATEEEKQRLFKAIKENGYKWNPETKTLEELPKFKVGDIIQNKAEYKVKITEINTEDRFYVCESLSYKNGIGIGNLSFDVQDGWELVPPIIPKFKVGDKIKHKVTSRYYTIEEVKNDCYYTKSNKDDECFSLVLFLFEKDYELVPNKFDISSLIPYESKVLVRNSLDGYWKPAFWGAYVPENPERHQNRNFLTTLGFTRYCIPFEGNEALTGTTNDCNEFYKIWEE